MAATNVDAAFGLRPANGIGPGDVGVNEYWISPTFAVTMYIGDPVSSRAGGTGASADGIPNIILATAGATVRGVITGFAPDATDLSLQYRKASTSRLAYVCDDPYAVFEVQEDSDGGAMTASCVGTNADIVVAAGNAYTGQSGVELDSSSTTAASGQLRILRLCRKPDNAIGTNAIWEVMINEHELKYPTAGVAT